MFLQECIEREKESIYTSPPTHPPSLRELREFGTQLEREVLGGAVATPSGTPLSSREKLLLPQPPPGQWWVGWGGAMGGASVTTD